MAVSKTFDAIVVGAGPAGSLVAARLAGLGHSVAMLDGRPATSIGPCCTGVVGEPYLDLSGLEADAVCAEERSAMFFSPSGYRLHVESSETQAYVLDRSLLEERLRERAVSAGAERVARMTALGASRQSNGLWSVRCVCQGGRQYLESRSVVLAHGSAPGLTRSVGLKGPRRFMVGAHVELEMNDVHETEVYFLQDLSRGMFAWLVPLGNSRVRGGVLSTHSASRLMTEFLYRPEMRSRLKGGVGTISQRPVPLAVASHMCDDGIMLVGDSAGQVKPTTGGGLYLGAVAADIASATLDEALRDDDLSARRLAGYEREWRRRFGSEVRRAAVARRIYESLSPSRVDRMISWAASSGIADELLQSGSFSFDLHGRTLMTGIVRALLGSVMGSRRSEESA